MPLLVIGKIEERISVVMQKINTEIRKFILPEGEIVIYLPGNGVNTRKLPYFCNFKGLPYGSADDFRVDTDDILISVSYLLWLISLTSLCLYIRLQIGKWVLWN